jgi:hypothetical protein
MQLTREKNECMATDILIRHGYKLTNPDESLVTAQIWEKDGESVKFTGWENTPKTSMMAENPSYINIEFI